MLQVPSTSQNQLPDRCGNMIQFQDGKRSVGVAPCHVFQLFTIIQLKQIRRSWACVVNTGEARFKTKQMLTEETTSGTFRPGC